MKEFTSRQLIKTERELDLLRDFLRSNQLPAEDLKLKDSLYLSFYNSNEELVGSGGLEFYASKVLLRSIAVNQAMRSQSLGKQIINDLLQHAKSRGIKEVYLLTQTAYYFFLKFGFSEINRDDVPEEIKSSTEFSEVCPSSARVMKLVLV